MFQPAPTPYLDQSPAIQLLLDDSTPFTPQKLAILEAYIADIFSGDLSKINVSNQVLSQLKNNSNSLFLNIQYILENSQLDKTKFYVLVAFEQRIQELWKKLNVEVKERIKDFFIQIFLKMAEAPSIATDQSTKPVLKKVLSILTKLFEVDWRNWPSFISTLIQKSKNNQFLCQNILELFKMIAQDVHDSIGRNFFETIIEKELAEHIKIEAAEVINLCIAILQSFKLNNNSIQPPLIVLSLECLELYLGLAHNCLAIPIDSTQLLVRMFHQNTYRSLAANVISILLQRTLSFQLAQRIITAIRTQIYSPEVNLRIERQKLLQKKTADVEAFDLLVRSLSGVVSKIITVLDNSQKLHSTSDQRISSIASIAFGYIIGFTELADVGVWNNCLTTWVIYFRRGLNCVDCSRLARALPTKCVTLVEDASSSSKVLSHVQSMVDLLSNNYLKEMLQTIWSNIQKLVHVKFNETLFNNLCHCYCQLNTKVIQHYRLNHVSVVTDFLKLLMNLSESIQPKHRSVVVRQILVVVSFYPGILLENEILKTAVEDKYFENIPDSLAPMARLVRSLPLSHRILLKLQDWTQKSLTQMNNQQNTVLSLWTIILQSQITGGSQVLQDYYQKATLSKHHALNYLIRALAGLELTRSDSGLLSWPFFATLSQQNAQTMSRLFQQGGERALKFSDNKVIGKLHSWMIKLCVMYGNLTEGRTRDAVFLNVVNNLRAVSTHQQQTQLLHII